MVLKVRNLVLLGLLLLVAVQLENSAGSHQRTTGKKLKIYGGKKTNVKKYPYLVKLKLRNGAFCAGTLISSKCVLTAAHCLLNATVASHIDVTLGINENRRSKGKDSRLAEHYNMTTKDMDVGILILDLPVQHFQSVQLDYTELEVGDSVEIIGYTYPKHKAKYTDLYAVETKVASIYDLPRFKKHTCRSLSYLSRNMFYVEEGKSTHVGDSGGPVFRNGHQVGIVAGGHGEHEYPFFVKLSSRKVEAFIEKSFELQDCYKESSEEW